MHSRNIGNVLFTNSAIVVVIAAICDSFRLPVLSSSSSPTTTATTTTTTTTPTYQQQHVTSRVTRPQEEQKQRPVTLSSYCFRRCCNIMSLSSSTTATTITISPSQAPISTTFSRRKTNAFFFNGGGTTSNELYCSAITVDKDDDSTDSTEYSSFDNNDDDDSTKIYLDSKSIIQPDDAVSNNIFSKYKERLLQMSTYASILCVIDCTLLPLITMVLPFLTMVTSTVGATSIESSFIAASFQAIIHHYGHLMTLYVVLPIGLFATITNYIYNHRNQRITLIGWIGLLCIYIANSGTGCDGSSGSAPHHHHDHGHHHHHHHATTNSLSSSTTIFPILLALLKSVQQGTGHRILNITGCLLLMTSNYLSHRQQQHSAKACCSNHTS